MTPDVRIRRCALTIRRRDGWSWGPGPHPHVEAAMAAIEASLAAALERAGIDADADVHLSEPVRLEIGGDGAVGAASVAGLVQRLLATRPGAVGTPGTRAPAGTAARDGGPAPGAEPVTPAGPGGGDDARDARAAAPGADDLPAAGDGGRLDEWQPRRREVEGAALARTLARWSRGGQMARIVRGWPPELVVEWLDAVAATAAQAGGGDDRMTASAVKLIADAILGERPDAPHGREAADRLLIVLAAVVAALGGRLPDPATQALARQAVEPAPPAAPAHSVAGGAGTPAGAPATAAIGPVAAPTSPPPADSPDREPAAAAAGDAPASGSARDEPDRRRRRGPAEHVVPALPLLVLAQLTRIGYVDAMVSAAAVAGLPFGAGALGAGIAGKVLAPPARDGTRGEDASAAIAIACDQQDDLLALALATAARRERALLAPLAAALQAAYAGGRSSRDEVLVSSGAEGIVCGEEAGLLPVAWVQTEVELDGVLASLGHPPVRRGDGFAPLAQALHRRPGLHGAPALDRHLGAVAGTALGLIAHHLWGSSRTATTPLLALERLGDLEARVRREPEGVIAEIPRGQRWQHLQRAGLLELFEIPWLPGGRLEIGTW